MKHWINYWIIPNLEINDFVLKDRFNDTLIACQIPLISGEYGQDYNHLYKWFKELLLWVCEKFEIKNNFLMDLINSNDLLNYELAGNIIYYQYINNEKK